MRCSIVLCIISIKLFVLSTVINAVSSEIEQDIMWPVFNYEEDFGTNSNWTTMFCHTIKRPISLFLDLYLTNRSYGTQHLFNALIRHWYNSSPSCINVISTRSIQMKYEEIENMKYEEIINWQWQRKSNDYFLYNLSTSTSVPQVESFVFNNPIMARVMIMPLTKIDFLMKYVVDHWNHKIYIVIFIILNNNHKITEMHIEDIERIYMNIARNILETLWNNSSVYNVFIGFPSLDSPGTKLWSYDPFSYDDIEQRLGRIAGVDPLMPPKPKLLRNLHGYKLNIGLFQAKLTAEIQSTKLHSKDHHRVIEDFHGVDGYMIQTMSKLYNFTVNIVPPFHGVEYGYVKNGKPVGTLADVLYQRIHASFNSQYIKGYIIGNEPSPPFNIGFTDPVDWDCVCIIVPSSEEIPKWLRAFIYMPPVIWVCLLIAIILATIVWYLVRNYHHSASRNYSKCHRNYLVVFIDTFMLVVGAPVRSANALGDRILVAALSFLGLTIMEAFTGTLYHGFTHEMFYRPIESLQKLDEYGLKVATASPHLEDIFGPKNPINKSSTLERLAHKIMSLPKNESAIKKTAYDRNNAAISRQNVFLILQQEYVDLKGRSLLHLIPDCPQAYHLAYLIPTNSVLLKPFNSVIRRLKEGGVTLYWNKNEIQKSIYKIKSATNNETIKVRDGPKSFSIQDMEICFLILGFGLFLSIIAFIIECIDLKKLRQVLLSKYRI